MIPNGTQDHLPEPPAGASLLSMNQWCGVLERRYIAVIAAAGDAVSLAKANAERVTDLEALARSQSDEIATLREAITLLLGN